jgi:phosphoglycolate phosphatase-like HAD superfamily hydrolase
MSDPAKPLRDLAKTSDFFVGIDSDGCVFDSMGIKQRECFCPWYIAYFGLQPVAEMARECKEFADLFSKSRGLNRHKTIVRILTELLPGHPQVKLRGFKVPEFKYYCKWVNDPASKLSDAGLEEAIANSSCEEEKAELGNVLEWSTKVNETVRAIVKNVPPFPYAREALQKIQDKADVIVCSQTPSEALEREWAEHGIEGYVSVIAGQEMGTKSEHLKIAIDDKYDRKKCIMIGDAPGDEKAARDNGILFFPINPHNGELSWKRFYEEAFDKFVAGEYAGDYEDSLIKEFHSQLPEKPDWNRNQ